MKKKSKKKSCNWSKKDTRCLIITGIIFFIILGVMILAVICFVNDNIPRETKVNIFFAMFPIVMVGFVILSAVSQAHGWGA